MLNPPLRRKLKHLYRGLHLSPLNYKLTELTRIDSLDPDNCSRPEYYLAFSISLNPRNGLLYGCILLSLFWIIEADKLKSMCITSSVEYQFLSRLQRLLSLPHFTPRSPGGQKKFLPQSSP
jgi:hypothetical protein